MHIRWNEEKSVWLERERGISFEEIRANLEAGNLLADLPHTQQDRYPGQRLLILCLHGRTLVVPYVEEEDGIFLKTAYVSRKAAKRYSGGAHEKG
ncbi:MAG: BrnT family toxin [Planctomycetes bacterium]|nr:BrnT family toxin [Planctomycetota bacterium]